MLLLLLMVPELLRLMSERFDALGLVAWAVVAVASAIWLLRRRDA